MKKKFIIGGVVFLLMICFAALSFSACGKDTSGDDPENENGITAERVDSIDKTLYAFNGHYYCIYNELLDWKAAALACEQVGGHLVTITSEAENEFLKALIMVDYSLENESIHIGALKKDGEWAWVTGEEFGFSTWSSGEPNGNADFGGIYTNKANPKNDNYIGTWDDRDAAVAFVCEWDKKEDIGKVVYSYTTTIDSVEELKAISNSDHAYALTSDIDLSGESDWQPIEGFSGILNGNGHVIKNLTINSLNEANIGLFGTLQGTVQNLTIENAQVTARGDAGKAGIVAGTNNGTISYVNVTGNVTPEYYAYVGGLVGYNDCGKIVGCVNQATVIGANYVGGIVGSALINTQEAISSCINEGAITGKDYVGGIAGYLTCVTSNATYQITNHTNKNTVTGDNRVGGVFGEVYAFYQRYNYRDYNSYFEMSVLTNSAEVTGSSTGNDVGGLIGRAFRLSKLMLSENTADITGGNCVGGFVGYAPDTNIKANGVKNNNTITGKGKIGGFAGHGGVIENAINNGEIISTGILVEDGNSRAYVGGIAGYCAGLIGCENNIDIKIESNGDYVGGLAGCVVVSASDRVNDNVNHGSVTGYNNVGGIAGYLTCVRSNATYQVSNNENRGAITGNSQIGGIFGYVYAFYQRYDYSDYNSYFSMSVLTNTAEVKGSLTGNDTGGLIGKAARLTLLTTCENTADVTGGICIGGFVGYAPDTNIKATGTVNNSTITGCYKVGGFAGHAGVIEYAVNSGEVFATGIDVDGQTFIGGIAGYCSGLIGCVNNMDISLLIGGKYVGGLAGYIALSKTNALYDNVNHGKIEGTDYVGGIGGYVTCVRSNATYRITDNENKNTVHGNSYVGGIAGYVYGFYERYNYNDYNSYFEIVNNVNEAEIFGVEKVGGICGGYNRLKTDANLIDTNTTLYGEKLGQ